MKKISIVLLLFLVLVTPNITFAKTEAGTTPDSFFYFFDTTFEKVGLFFTFNHEKKAEKLLEYAQERLSEVEEMVKKEKTENIEELMNKYQENISFATDETKNLEDDVKVEELFATISETILENEESLNITLEKIPEEIKTKIFQIVEDVKKENEEVKKQIQELKQEVTELKKEIKELKEDNGKKELEEKVSTNEQAKEIEELKKQVKELKVESLKTEEKTQYSDIVSLPNGAIIEMNSDGSVLRYIKEADKKEDQMQNSNIMTLPNGAVVEMGADGSIVKYIKMADKKTDEISSTPVVFKTEEKPEGWYFIDKPCYDMVNSVFNEIKKECELARVSISYISNSSDEEVLRRGAMTSKPRTKWDNGLKEITLRKKYSNKTDTYHFYVVDWNGSVLDEATSHEQANEKFEKIIIESRNNFDYK